MNPRSTQGILVALLAVASLGTTALIGLLVWQRTTQPDLQATVLDPGDPHDPRVLFTLPDFQLTNHHHQPFSRTHLTGPPGHARVVGFIFARCSGPCPRITSAMSSLQHDLPPTARLVTFSVDPNHDTPAVLAEYARLAHADPDRWTFVTGDRTALWALIRDGFKLPVGASQDPDMPIMHTQKLVLVDHQARVRGLYDVLEPQGRAALLTDLAKLTATTTTATAPVTTP